MATDTGYEVVDAHIHLCRDTAQQKVVFPKRGWPDDWYWCNTDKIVPYMDQNFISHIVVLNVMVTKAMTEARTGAFPATRRRKRSRPPACGSRSTCRTG